MLAPPNVPVSWAPGTRPKNPKRLVSLAEH
jgi:hypothetical protein